MKTNDLIFFVFIMCLAMFVTQANNEKMTTIYLVFILSCIHWFYNRFLHHTDCFTLHERCISFSLFDSIRGGCSDRWNRYIHNPLCGFLDAIIATLM